MLTSAPVRGLRPIPVLRGFTLKTPKPRNSMRSPCVRAFFIGIEHRFDGHFRFCLGNARAIDNFINNVQLYHANLLKIQALILRRERSIVKSIFLDYDFHLFAFRTGTILWADTTPQTRTLKEVRSNAG